MEIVIKIPESFEGHFNQDRFKDSFERILEDCKHSAILSGNYEFETIEMLIRAFENGTPLPKGHGRLIDADAYKSEINRIFPCQSTDDKNIRRATEIGIDNAPTIVEADGGE